MDECRRYNHARSKLLDDRERPSVHTLEREFDHQYRGKDPDEARDEHHEQCPNPERDIVIAFLQVAAGCEAAAGLASAHGHAVSAGNVRLHMAGGHCAGSDSLDPGVKMAIHLLLAIVITMIVVVIMVVVVSVTMVAVFFSRREDQDFFTVWTHTISDRYQRLSKELRRPWRILTVQHHEHGKPCIAPAELP